MEYEISEKRYMQTHLESATIWVLFRQIIDQRDYDATVFIRLCELGWVPLRITHGLLRNPRRLIATLRHAIKRAEDNAKS